MGCQNVNLLDNLIFYKKGTFIPCSCKKVAIDETKYYTRIIGNDED